MMKAIIVALASLPVAGLAENVSDLSPGAIEISGDTTLRISKGSTKVDSDQSAATAVKTDTGEYVLDASGFYYVTTNVGLGLSISYEKETEETGANDQRMQMLVLGPAVSLHFPIAPALAVFGRGMLGYATSRTWGENVPDLKGTGYGYTLQAGVRYFPVAQISLNAGASYAYAKLTTDDVTTPTGPVPGVDATSKGLTVFAGLSVYFGR
jgi:opacity protein-like surface antigen